MTEPRRPRSANPPAAGRVRPAPTGAAFPPPAQHPANRAGAAPPAPPQPASGQPAPTANGGARRGADPARKRRNARRRKAPIPWVTIIALTALLALAVTGLFSLASETARYSALAETRRREAARLQAHRDEHLNARRNSGLLPLIRKYAQEYGVEAAMVSAVIKNESSFNPRAVSSVGARGLMQIMPDTGVWLAQRMGIPDYAPDRLFEPEFNIRMGTYYLAYLSDIFSGSPVMVAAAFHAGDGNVKRWALDRAQDMKTITLDMIPTDDTRSYVRKVMDAYAIYYADEFADKGALPAAVPAAAAGGGGAGQ